MAATDETQHVHIPSRSDGPTPTAYPAVPGYAILRELGRGGMGVVYHAIQLQLQRPVALKMILTGTFASEKELARFRSEAESVARLQHSNIVQVFEIGELPGGMPYFAMEFVAGGTLHDRLNDQPQPPRAAAELVEQLARAVQHAHDQGVLHRDLKPANVLLVGPSPTSAKPSDSTTEPERSSAARRHYGEPKITDFGLAKRLDGSGQTASQTLIGTPSYMAPEQAESGPGREIGPATDVYALGVILYEMLAGRPPFVGHDAVDTLMQLRMLDAPPPSLWGPRLPADLQTICLKCLEKSPSNRYTTAVALADELRRFLDGDPILARPAGTLEKALKWGRRRPLVAGLLASIALSTGLGVAGILWQARRAFRERDRAVEQSEIAIEAQRKAHDQEVFANKNLYFSRIARASAGCQSGDYLRAAQQLELCQSEHRRWEWYYLKQVAHGELAQFRGPGDQSWIRGVSIASDGEWVALAGGGNVFNDDGLHPEPGLVSLVNMTKGESKLLSGHTDIVTACAFHPADERLATASDDHTVRIWNRDGASLYVLRDHPGKLEAVGWSPDGRRVAAAGNGGLYIWNADTGAVTLRCAEDEGDIHGLAFSPDGQEVALAIDLYVKVYDTESGKLLRECSQHLRAVRAVSWSRDGKLLASGGDDGAVRVWDAEKCVEVRVPGVHNGWVWSVAFSPDGTRIAAGGNDRMVTVWPIAGGRELTLRGPAGPVRALAWTPGSEGLLSGGQDNIARLWNPHTDPQNRLIPGQEDRLTLAVQWIAATKQLALHRTFQEGIQVWTPGDPKPAGRRSIQGYSGARMRPMLQITPDGQSAIGRCGNHLANRLAIWDLTESRIRLLDELKLPLVTVAITTDGATAAALTFNIDRFAENKNGPPLASELYLYDVASGRRVQSITVNCLEPAMLAFDTSGKRLAILSGVRGGGIIRTHLQLVDLRTGEVAQTFDSGALKYNLTAVAIEPSGRFLAACSDYDPRVFLWDLQTGERKGQLTAAGKVGALAFSPDGSRLAATGYDSSVTLWDMHMREPVIVLSPNIPQRPGDRVFPLRMLFSQDGTKLITTNWDGSVNVFDSEAPPKPKLKGT